MGEVYLKGNGLIYIINIEELREGRKGWILKNYSFN